LEKEASKYVVVHAGMHWPSKTFPKMWWDSVLSGIRSAGLTPILIGKDGKMIHSENTGTVDVSNEGCIDLRNQTNLQELVWLLQNCNVLITNDSSPIHIAASGKAHIGFIASCKHPDYITHWRNGTWGWRMKNLGHDGIWNYTDHYPVQDDEIRVDVLPNGLMDRLLPSTEEVLQFIKGSMQQE
jgi:ADP-heptose:LPS heptosyltransferase